MKKFINFTNHHSSGWNRKQREAALMYGEIVDIPFPDISPELTDEELYSLAQNYTALLLSEEADCVLCQGESVFSVLMVSMLIKNHVPVAAAVSRRTVMESTNENGQTIKRSVFEFKGFRKYILDHP